MCIVSAVGDNFRDGFGKRYPGWTIPEDAPRGPIPTITPPANITREEFLALKKEVELLKELLIKAIQYDKETGQPHCEQDEKIAMLKAIAKVVGVDLDEVFKD